MISFEPIGAHALAALIEQACLRMSLQERNLWHAIRIEPIKWQQNPYGSQGNGFWVVAIAGSMVVWYNDIEDGFNRSRYFEFGTIEDYWCNQDGLEIALRGFISALDVGIDLARMVPVPADDLG